MKLICKIKFSKKYYIQNSVLISRLEIGVLCSMTHALSFFSNSNQFHFQKAGKHMSYSRDKQFLILKLDWLQFHFAATLLTVNDLNIPHRDCFYTRSNQQLIFNFHRALTLFWLSFGVRSGPWCVPWWCVCERSSPPRTPSTNTSPSGDTCPGSTRDIAPRGSAATPACQTCGRNHVTSSYRVTSSVKWNCVLQLHSHTIYHDRVSNRDDLAVSSRCCPCHPTTVNT